jgi:hypothetical protein
MGSAVRREKMSEFGYWTFAGKNGLTGAESSLEELDDGRVLLVKNPEFPAVLEDEQILFALRGSRIARSSFLHLFPTLDQISQYRLNELLGKNPWAARLLEDPFFDLSYQDRADLIQKKQVTAGSPQRNFLEPPKPTP